MDTFHRKMNAINQERNIGKYVKILITNQVCYNKTQYLAMKHLLSLQNIYKCPTKNYGICELKDVHLGFVLSSIYLPNYLSHGKN